MQNDSREKRLFIKTQHAINKHESAILRQRENTALDKARSAAHISRHKYGCRKVILYGSLACEGFGLMSDIDLLIEGFTGNFWSMYNHLENIAAPFEISIVCSENASPSLKEEIKLHGVVL